MNKKPILCLDFDGVLHSYTSGWKEARVIPDPPVSGAIEFLLQAMGCFDLAIHSSRSHRWGGRRAMKRWLRTALDKWRIDNGVKWIDLPYYAQDYSAPPGYDEDKWSSMIVKKIRWPVFKPPAMIILDDRAIMFDGTWPDIESLQNFKPWNKREVKR